jgi:hypothetical protein
LSDADSTFAAKQRRRRWLTLLIAACIVELGHLYVVSAGRWTGWPTFLSFLDDQAEGFRAGHLYLAVEPPRELLKAANPFDPALRQFWYWDASLYNGHYYIYWGPVPALMLTGYKVLFRVTSRIGDERVVFVLVTLRLAAGTMLVERIGRRCFPAAPNALLGAALLVFGFATPTPFILNRGAVYEAAIVGGEAFLLLGCVFALDAVVRAGLRGGRWRLVAAGVAWGLAIGCRISSTPAVAGAALVTLASAAKREPDVFGAARRLAVPLFGPIGFAVLGLLAFNKARFDSWFSFGQSYQLTWITFAKSFRYVPYNVYSYTLRPFVYSCKFPFAFAPFNGGPRPFPAWMHVPEGYSVGEPLVGALAAVPWLWLTPASFLIFKSRRGPTSGYLATSRWLVVWCAAVLLGIGAVLLPLYTTTMRYLGDGMGVGIVLATIGACAAHAELSRWAWARRAVCALALILACASIGLGWALGFRGYYELFEHVNPATYQTLVRRLSICRDPKALLEDMPSGN